MSKRTVIKALLKPIIKSYAEPTSAAALDNNEEGTVIKATGHKGGKATCIKKAVCTVCGKEYGEVDLKNHEGDTELRNYKWEDCTKGLYSGIHIAKHVEHC